MFKIGKEGVVLLSFKMQEITILSSEDLDVKIFPGELAPRPP